MEAFISTPITIQGTTINFPVAGDSPQWGPAITQFAQLVSQALAGVVGPFDVAPQIFVMTANVNTNVNLSNLAFPTSNVVGAFIRYTVTRSTTSETVTETGDLWLNFNTTRSVGQKWEISRSYEGDSSIQFNVTDVGQVQFSTSLLPGSNHQGIITYSATAFLNS